MSALQQFAVQYIATVRGKLVDKEVIVRAASSDAARHLVQSRNPLAHIHFAEQVSA